MILVRRCDGQNRRIPHEGFVATRRACSGKVVGVKEAVEEAIQEQEWVRKKLLGS